MSKLVRDKIPEIIESDTGVAPAIHTVSGAKLLKALDVKINEEVAELRSASSSKATAEEIADVVEVLLTIAKNIGYSPEQIEAIRLEKREKR